LLIVVSAAANRATVLGCPVSARTPDMTAGERHRHRRDRGEFSRGTSPGQRGAALRQLRLPPHRRSFAGTSVACVLLRSPQGAVLQCASGRSATARNRSGGRTGRRWWTHRLPDGSLLGTGLPARNSEGLQ